MLLTLKTAGRFCFGALFFGTIVSMTLTSHRSAAGSELSSPKGADTLAQQILDATEIKGGLIVHLGCGDGKLTAAFHSKGTFLVHGLDEDKQNVLRAREHVHSAGLLGAVSIDRCDGRRLPYVDNLVNLVVVEEIGTIPMEEVLRVLCPQGIAYIRRAGSWSKRVKPRPAQIDEWTHFLHDATNNAVAHDSVVGPPDQLQWVGEPKWARSHDHLASVSAAVCSGGRIFSIVDTAPIAAVVLKPRWVLVARDAFNGVVLWERPIENWQWHLRGFRNGPSDLARRLVAVNDRVYVTLDIDGPLVALDAATGKTAATYDVTKSAYEVVHDQSTLFVIAGQSRVQLAAADAQRRRQRPGLAEIRSQRPAYREENPAKRILAIDSESDRVLWEKGDTDTSDLMPTTLAVSHDRVFFQNADNVVCLDSESGDELWRAARDTSPHRPTWSAPTLVVFGDVVLSADRAVAEKQPQGTEDQSKVEWIVTSQGGQAPVGELIAFSAESGERLWSCPCREGYNSPVDVLVADGLVWTGNVVRAKDPGFLEGRDPKTGQVRRTRPNDQTYFAAGMGHGRCYRNKATDRFLVVGRSGVEFVDVASGVAVPNHWTRGTCQYGVIPCNGLLYVPPHSCACFIASKINGFNCLAPRRQPVSPPREDLGRLEEGPAHGTVNTGQGQSPYDWPTYRHDPARSGHTAQTGPRELEHLWQTTLGGKLSSVVIADGRLLVAQIDAHTVHALDAEDGRHLWSYTTGGRVDSPPTMWEGRVVFGSADGWVYCLQASDGTLAWRFRVAPQDQRIVASGQLESAWPVPGSVLVHDRVVYCVAGRSSYLDGGIRLVGLDGQTGRKMSENIVDDRDPKTGYQRKGVVRGTSMPGALPDVLSCDGTSIFMRHTRFDLAGQQLDPTVTHLYSAAGFLDDTWWHRTYWLLGATMGTNYGGWPNTGNRTPAGRLLALDDSSVYGFGRNQYIHHGAHVGIDGAMIFHFNPKRDAQRRETRYRAFAMDRHATPANRRSVQATKTKTGKQRQRTPAAKTFRWTRELPILARAMVLTNDRLFLSGPPDLFATENPTGAMEGAEGGLLCVLSPDTGEELVQSKLDSPPVHDGMAIARGQLYLATMDGKVLCLGD